MNRMLHDLRLFAVYFMNFVLQLRLQYMARIVMLLLILCGAGSIVHAQTDNGELRGLRNGRYRFENNHTKITGFVVRHRMTGTWRYYYRASPDSAWKQERVCYYRKGQPHGQDISFDMQGDTTVVGHYVHGMRVGEWRGYNHGVLTSVLHYDNTGQPTGWNYVYYSEGALMNKWVVVHHDTSYHWYYNRSGTLHSRGVQTTYGRQGRWYSYAIPDSLSDSRDTFPAEVMHYRNNLPHGREERYQKGQLVYEAHYAYGYRDSVERGYINGVIVHEAWYHGGKKQGPDRSFSPEGKPAFWRNYKMDVLHGEQREYSTNTGVMIWQTWFTEGREDSSFHRSEEDVLITSKRLVHPEQGIYEVERFDEKGRLSYSGFELQSKPHGVCTWWNADGSRRLSLTYHHNLLNGAADVWNAKGTHVFHAEALHGISARREEIYDERGKKLQPGTKAYIAQRERYMPDGLVAYDDDLFFVSGIIITSTGRANNSGWASYSTTFAVDSANNVFCNGRIAPQFPGGDTAQLSWFRAHLHYPAMEREINIGGTVSAEFYVQADGSIDSVRVLRGSTTGFNQEALRALSAMPDWLPAAKNGKAGAARCVMEIRFVSEWVD